MAQSGTFLSHVRSVPIPSGGIPRAARCWYTGFEYVLFRSAVLTALQIEYADNICPFWYN